MYKNHIHVYPGTIEFPLAVGPAYTESGTAFSGSLGRYRRGRDLDLASAVPVDLAIILIVVAVELPTSGGA